MNDLEKLALIINNAFEKLYAKIDSLSKEIKNTPAPQVTIQPPDVNVNVPKVIVPEINIPEVKLPPFPEIPPFPEVVVPQPIVNIEKSDPPIVNVPAPIVNVPPANIKIEPKIDFPKKFQIEGMDELLESVQKEQSPLKNIDSRRPLPVMIMDKKGNRVSDFGGDFQAPSVIQLKNNAAQAVLINPATEDTLATIDAVLDAIKVDTEAIETAVELIDDAISGNEMQVDVVTMPPVVITEAAPTTVVAFTTDIPTAGSRVQLATNTIVAGVLQAPSTNTGNVFIGGSNVSSSVFGAELQPGQSVGIAISNTNKIYIDAATNGDDVGFLGS